MQAQEWALALLWENIGVHGDSSETGKLKDATSVGPKQSASSSSPPPSSHCMAPITTSSVSATTPESLKDGGKAPAGTPKPTSSSAEYTMSRTLPVPISIHG